MISECDVKTRAGSYDFLQVLQVMFLMMSRILGHWNVFPYSLPTFQQALYELSRKSEFRPFFQNLLWQQRIGFMYCEAIDAKIDCLLIADILYLRDGRDAGINPKRIDYLEKCSQDFSNDELDLLKKMAEDLLNKIAPKT